MISFKILTALMLVSLCHQSMADYFMSISSLETLMMTSERTLQRLEGYVRRERERLYTVNRLLRSFQSEIKNVTHEPQYMTNLYNYFKLLKRLTVDLNLVNSATIKKTEYKRDPSVKFPNATDLDGAALGMLRVQVVYRLNTSTMANAMLHAPYNSMPVLTASDCYELGHNFVYQLKFYNEGLIWLLEALRKCKEQCDKLSEVKIIKHISNAYFYLEDIPAAFKWRERYLNKIPVKTRIIQKTIYRLHSRQQKMIDVDANRTEPYNNFIEASHALCRGEVEIPKSVEKSLKCHYISGPHWWLHLTRVRAEQLYARPDILLIRDLISDAEIEQLKNAALIKKMTSSATSNTNTTRLSNHRICKSAWVSAEEAPAVKNIRRRISAITGFTEGNEDLQVTNYGIGGLFHPHEDYFGKYQNGTYVSPEEGDRLATVMIYMSEVAQGGATVFLHPGLTVWPQKGAALYWNNLHPSGEADPATEHAACPVLQGSKWVSVLWKHQAGQELVKPCNLEHQKMKDVRLLHPRMPKKDINVYYGDSIV